MDSEEEICEETYVVVEFAGNTGEDALKQENLSINIIGIHEEQPLVQIGNQLYAGEYSETLGTELVFTEAANNSSVDTVFETKIDCLLEYVTKTNKKLVIKRAFATKKESSREASGTVESENVQELPSSE